MSDSCEHMNCSPPGSSVHGVFQARILEWIAISFSRGSSQPRKQTQVSSIADRFSTDWSYEVSPVQSIGVPKVAHKKKGHEKTLEEIIVENSIKWGRKWPPKSKKSREFQTG